MTIQPRILIVEDELEIRKFLRATLSANDMNPIEAMNAKEATSQLVGNMPDLVILDLGLPDKEGQELICEWREWCRVPIIVLTARDDEKEIVSALENGADDYLTKPFSTSELVARIKVALRRKSDLTNGSKHIFEYLGLVIDYSARPNNARRSGD